MGRWVKKWPNFRYPLSQHVEHKSNKHQKDMSNIITPLK